MAGAIAYGALIIFLRISGKRTLAKMNAFDFIVTIAIGSTLSSILTSTELPIANGVLALALLIALQYGVAWLSVRRPSFNRLVKSQPAAVFAEGEFDRSVMLRERVAHDEVLMAVRGAGVDDLDEVLSVVLETDGSLSVVKRDETPRRRPAGGDVAST
jgi:uncharacterized membrane protein YcaP (DUF421 family)